MTELPDELKRLLPRSLGAAPRLYSIPRAPEKKKGRSKSELDAMRTPCTLSELLSRWRRIAELWNAAEVTASEARGCAGRLIRDGYRQALTGRGFLQLRADLQGLKMMPSGYLDRVQAWFAMQGHTNDEAVQTPEQLLALANVIERQTRGSSKSQKGRLFHSGHDETEGIWSPVTSKRDIAAAIGEDPRAIVKLLLPTGLVQKSRQKWVFRIDTLTPAWQKRAKTYLGLRLKK